MVLNIGCVHGGEETMNVERERRRWSSGCGFLAGATFGRWLVDLQHVTILPFRTKRKERSVSKTMFMRSRWKKRG
jgi:hypothetical protein